MKIIIGIKSFILKGEFKHMQRTIISKVLQSTTAITALSVCGWVRTKRDSKGFSFIELNDGSCLANVQCVILEKSPAYAMLEKINTGAAIKVSGDLLESPGKGQKWEIQVQDIEIFGYADQETYPLQKKRHTDEFLRSIAHLRVRTNKYGAIFRIRSEVAYAIHQYFKSEDFYYVHTPILTGADCEGAGEMFRVSSLPPGDNNIKNDFFAKECNLTVSGQLEAEALALGLGKVYTFGPTFRAENSNTTRHAAEFWMVEPEMAFADIFDNMDLAEGLIKYVTDYVLTNCFADLTLFDKYVDTQLIQRLTNTLAKPFLRIPYGEAIDILKVCPKSFEYAVNYGLDLQTEHERYLTEEHFNQPIIVYNYPASIKPFYMRLNDDGQTVAAMDVLVPRIGELVGGSQREERLSNLEQRITDLGQNPSDYWWYLDLRRYGSAPHAGFGLGFERLLMMLTGIVNIRDVIPFPRTPGSLEF